MDKEQAVADSKCVNDLSLPDDSTEEENDEAEPYIDSDDQSDNASAYGSDIGEDDVDYYHSHQIQPNPNMTREEREECYLKIAKEYYLKQNKNKKSKGDIKQVAIWIEGTVSKYWKKSFKDATNAINTAAPGLHLHIVDNKQTSIIQIFCDSSSGAKTKKNLLSYGFARITVGNLRHFSLLGRSSVHELLHALGFKHEHQSQGAEHQVNINVGAGNQYKLRGDVINLTRFDPYSIMMYSEGKHLNRGPKCEESIWKQKKQRRNDCMSELDKVGLNLLYPPYDSAQYNPTWNPSTSMYYCFREVMKEHNRPLTDFPLSDSGKCGESKQDPRGPNCPACRTLEGELPPDPESPCWQGWSGMYYCGMPFRNRALDGSHKGRCGPDYGDPCPKCRDLVYPAANGQ